MRGGEAQVGVALQYGDDLPEVFFLRQEIAVRAFIDSLLQKSSGSDV